MFFHHHPVKSPVLLLDACFKLRKKKTPQIDKHGYGLKKKVKLVLSTLLKMAKTTFPKLRSGVVKCKGDLGNARNCHQH